MNEKDNFVSKPEKESIIFNSEAIFSDKEVEDFLNNGFFAWK